MKQLAGASTNRSAAVESLTLKRLASLPAASLIVAGAPPVANHAGACVIASPVLLCLTFYGPAATDFAKVPPVFCEVDSRLTH